MMTLEGTTLVDPVRGRLPIPEVAILAMKALATGYADIKEQHGLALTFLGLARRRATGGYSLTVEGEYILDQLKAQA